MISSLHLLFLGGGTLLLSALLVPPIRRLAWRLDLVDRPRDGLHKSHARVTPYGGGIAIWLVSLIATLLLICTAPPDQFAQWLRPAVGLLSCATLLFLTGLVDDWRSMPPLPRFLIQLAATLALLLTCPEFRLSLFPSPLLAIPLSILWIVALTNAFNFLDNMDGLSAGVAAAILVLLAALAHLTAQPAIAAFCILLLGAVIGFLLYNFPPASLFMGDAGGFFLGFVVSGTSALLCNRMAHLHADLPHRLAPLLLLAVPLYDQLGVSLIRLKQRIPPWIGDKNHISHRLVDLGLSRRGAVLCIYALTLLFGLPALFIPATSVPSAWLPIALIFALAGLTALLDIETRRRRRNRS